MLCFPAQAGYKMEAFCCGIPSSCTQSRGQKWDVKIWLPFLPGDWSKVNQSKRRKKKWSDFFEEITWNVYNCISVCRLCIDSFCFQCQKPGHTTYSSFP
jgi:hypothetical protein